MEVAKAEIPTGFPRKFSIITRIILLSISSKPNSSTFKEFNANLVIPISISPFPLISAKSRTLRKSAFAILGVPRLLLAISSAASS
ncbi:hypothetical protein D3C86_1665210 [compost metagenome]